MSLHVWRCRCGRRWYQFGRRAWDSISGLTNWCPGCTAEVADTTEGWSEL